MVEKNINARQPIMVPIIYIKDKQAFAKAGGVMRFLGPAVETIKKLSEKYGLFHINDLDLKKGSMANFDVYDKLTYFTHIQVECEDEKAIEKLLRINARVVISLPTLLKLERWDKRLLVGIAKTASEDISMVKDIIIAGEDKIAIKKIMEKCAKEKKRIIINFERWDKKIIVWAVILDAP